MVCSCNLLESTRYTDEDSSVALTAAPHCRMSNHGISCSTMATESYATAITPGHTAIKSTCIRLMTQTLLVSEKQPNKKSNTQCDQICKNSQQRKSSVRIIADSTTGLSLSHVSDFAKFYTTRLNTSVMWGGIAI